MRKNTGLKFPTISLGCANSPAAPREGFRDITVSSTPEYLDLTVYKGQLIQVHVAGSDQGTGFYLAFVGATGATLDVDARAMASDGSFDATATSVEEVPDGHRDLYVVPHDRPWLAYRTIGAGGNGRIHVRKA